MNAGILTRRRLLRGLVAAPAVAAIGNLMPIRGLVVPIGARLVDAAAPVLWRGLDVRVPIFFVEIVTPTTFPAWFDDLENV